LLFFVHVFFLGVLAKLALVLVVLLVLVGLVVLVFFLGSVALDRLFLVKL
jgi:hypothetical protein